MNTVVVTGIRQLSDGSFPVGTMVAFGKTLRTSCIIINRFERGLSILYSEPSGKPYQPLQFPAGIWPIIDCELSTNPEIAPVFIRTGAHQMVPVWNVENGKYVSPAGEYCDDWGDGIHFDGMYETTDGCLHLYSADDALWFKGQFDELKEAGEAVQIAVA